MLDGVQEFADRLAGIHARMSAACARAGRCMDEVQLVSVSKTRSPDEVERAAQCGLELFGENRVQEAAAKIPLCSSKLHWHLIGHLQSNKVSPAVHLFEMIHSLDSLSLLQRVNTACEIEGRHLPVLLEVNVSGEASKFGLPPDGVRSVIQAAACLGQVEIKGLMTIPPPSEESERMRVYFRALRCLRDQLRDQTGLLLPELSMGMSGDFEVAIEEGATFVRIGTDLFGPRTARTVTAEE